jgi:hypothetical protein
MNMSVRMFGIVAIALCSFGCAAKQQCPKMPETACGQCALQIEAQMKDSAVSAAALATEGADTVLAFLKKSEKYLSERVEEWKTTHPELVAEGQASLDALRAKIVEYERRARSALRESL